MQIIVLCRQHTFMKVIFEERLNTSHFLKIIIYLIIIEQFITYNTMKAAISSYRANGYGLIKNFMTEEQCGKAVKQIDRLIQSFEPTKQNSVIFSTQKEDSTRQNDYFLESSDKVRFFLEEKAYINGKLVVPKLQSINKIGHALHEHNQIFKNFTFNALIGQICKELNMLNPVVIQSMAILKPPKVGGLVNIHQDSTFLYDYPQTLVGFWIPLQDATVNNGCLWGLPGSHKGPLYSRSRMNWKQKKSYMEKKHEIDYKESDFIPIQMKKGQLAFFSGRFLHKSHSNSSPISRYAYTWHLKQKNSNWASDNWLQRPNFPQFQFKQTI